MCRHDQVRESGEPVVNMLPDWIVINKTNEIPLTRHESYIQGCDAARRMHGLLSNAADKRRDHPSIIANAGVAMSHGMRLLGRLNRKALPATELEFFGDGKQIAPNRGLPKGLQ